MTTPANLGDMKRAVAARAVEEVENGRQRCSSASHCHHQAKATGTTPSGDPSTAKQKSVPSQRSSADQ
jgi:hypothetical protein